jgi:hypothetical protein
MRQRGRKSSAELKILQLSPARRQPPPTDLSPAEATEWTSIVNRMPGGWFGTETHALLKGFCRHSVEADRISGMLAVLDAALADDEAQGRAEIDLVCESAQTRDRLLRMRDRETRAAAALARAMRLTQQSAYDKTKAGSAERREGMSPWEFKPQ